MLSRILSGQTKSSAALDELAAFLGIDLDGISDEERMLALYEELRDESPAAAADLIVIAEDKISNLRLANKREEEARKARESADGRPLGDRRGGGSSSSRDRDPGSRLS